MFQWSAIVYSRTYEVDFRFMAIPGYFNDQDQKWAKNYILGTTRSTGSLDVQPRWSLFKNERYCVIGVTCRASDLIEPHELASEDRTKDGKKRPIFAFVGYVTQLVQEQDLLTIPPYTGKNLELFAPLYQQYVSNPAIWFVASYEKASKEPIKSEAQELCYPTLNQPTEFDSRKYQLQTNDDISCFWPDSKTDRENLWVAVAQQVMNYPNLSQSLCLSLSTQSEASYSPFWNGTALDVVEPVLIKRTKTVEVQNTPVEIKTNSLSKISPSTAKTYYSAELSNNNQTYLKSTLAVGSGAALGSFVGWKIGGLLGLIPGGLIGGGIGWLATTWLTNEDDSQASLKRDQSWNDDDSSHSTSKRTELTELDYGFTSNNQQKNPSNSDSNGPQNLKWF